MKKSPKKRDKKPCYNWPPPVAPEDVYVPKQKNPIHSIITALPVIMLVTGLYFYYQAESEQTHSAPIRAESVNVSGVFTGLSVVKSGSQGRHYLWLDENGSTRGFRIQSKQAETLQSLERGATVSLSAAPTISQSKTLWAWHIEQGGAVMLDSAESLQ